MNMAHMQQQLDTHSAVAFDLVMEKEGMEIPFSLLIRAEHLDRFIQMVIDNRFVRALRGIQRIVRAGSYPKSIKVRIGSYRSLARHVVGRGGIPAIREESSQKSSKKPLKNLCVKPSKVKKGTLEFKVLGIAKKLKKLNLPVDSGIVAKKLKIDKKRSIDALRALTKKGWLEIRKPKEGEEVSPYTKAVYEVAS